MPLSTSVSSSLEISLTFLLPAGRWPPGPPCCSSAGGGPSSGFQPVLGGTPEAAPPAVTSANAETAASRKNLVLRDTLYPLCQRPLPIEDAWKGVMNLPPSAFRESPCTEIAAMSCSTALPFLEACACLEVMINENHYRLPVGASKSERLARRGYRSRV